MPPWVSNMCQLSLIQCYGFLLASGGGARKPWKGNGPSHKQLQIFISILGTGQVSIGLSLNRCLGSIFNSQANIVVTQWKHTGLLRPKKKEPGTQLDHSLTNAWQRPSEGQSSGVLETLSIKAPQKYWYHLSRKINWGQEWFMRSLLSTPMFLPGPMLNTGTR